VSGRPLLKVTHGGAGARVYSAATCFSYKHFEIGRHEVEVSINGCACGRKEARPGTASDIEKELKTRFLLDLRERLD
jgi:hypothetical protein